MSSTIKSSYGAVNQAITCTITSLGSSVFRSSAVIDNTANLFLDAEVQVKVKTAAAATSATGYIAVYAYGTADFGAGNDYTDGVTGTDANFVPTTPPNLRLIGIINANINATTYVGGPFSVAAAFGGILPDHWGIVIENETGATLDAAVGSVWFQGYYNQVV